MARRKLGFALKLLVAGGLFAWLFGSGRIDLRDFAAIRDGWPWFVAAIVPYGLVLLLCALRWRLLLRAQGIEYTLRDTVALTLVGHLFNQFLIGTTGGDMVKAYAVAIEQPGRRGAGVMSVVVDRIIGLLVLVLVALGAITLNLEAIGGEPRLQALAWLAGALFAGSACCGYAFFSERVRSHAAVRWLTSKLPLRERIVRLSEAVYVYKHHPGVVLAAVALSVAVHLLVVLTSLFLAFALTREPFPWATFLFLIPLAQIAMAIPVNPPGAAGTGEWIYQSLLPFAGVPQGGAVCLLQRFVYYAWACVGCFCYLRRKSKVARAMEAAQEDEESHEAQQRHEAQGDHLARSVRDPGPPAHRHRELCERVDSGAREA